MYTGVVALKEVSGEVFPQPDQDQLGLRHDNFLLATYPCDDGQEFVLANTRPFMGQSLNFFLDNEAPYKRGGLYRQYLGGGNMFSRLQPQNAEQYNDGDFEYRLHRLHQHIGKHGIGEALLAFYDEIYEEWTDAYQDSKTDSVYFPLNQMQIYSDFRGYTEWQTEHWKEIISDESNRRGAEPVHRLASEVAPTKRLEGMAEWLQGLLTRAYHVYGHEGSRPYQNVVRSRFARNMTEYLDDLSPDEAGELVGNALSRFPFAREGNTNHTLARRLIIDLSGKHYWIEMPYVYDPKRGSTDELQFPEPKIEFDNDGVNIIDDNGVSVEIECEESEDVSTPSKWSVRDYSLPSSNYQNGQFPTIAWRLDNTGQRSFLDQSGTVEAVRSTNMSLAGNPDSYLGKLVIRHFRKDGEYQPSASTKKWQTKMNLPGSDSLGRKITIRELPVWIQLPQHQPDLLNSQFIKTAESLVA